MADPIVTRKIKLQFNVTPSETSTSTKRTWTINEAITEDDSITTDIQTLVTAMITNNSIFDTPPLSIIKAEIEETTTTTVLPNE